MVYLGEWSMAGAEVGGQDCNGVVTTPMDGPHLRVGQAYCPRPNNMEFVTGNPNQQHIDIDIENIFF